jgi:uncharacterized membrane protein
VSDLIAITFDGPEQAGKALRALKQVERRSLLHRSDTVVIRMDAERPIHTKDALDPAVELGVSVVGTFSMLLAIAFRVAGVVARPAGRSWAFSRMHRDIDQEFLDLLRNDLRPGTSALLLMVNNVKPHAIPEIYAAIRPFRGTVYWTALSYEAQRFLRDAVEGPCDVSTR